MHTWGWLKRNTQQHPWFQWLLILQSPKVPPLIEPYYYHCSLWSTQRASQNREKFVRHSYYVRFTEESVVNYPHTCMLNTCNVTVQNQVMDSSGMNHLSIRDSVDWNKQKKTQKTHQFQCSKNILCTSKLQPSWLTGTLSIPHRK